MLFVGESSVEGLTEESGGKIRGISWSLTTNNFSEPPNLPEKIHFLASESMRNTCYCEEVRVPTTNRMI